MIKDNNKMETRIIPPPDIIVPEGNGGICLRWRNDHLTHTIHIWRYNLNMKIEEYVIDKEHNIVERNHLKSFSIDPEDYS